MEASAVVSRMAKFNMSCVGDETGWRLHTSTGSRNVTVTFIGPACMTCIVRVGVRFVVTRLLLSMPTL